MYFHENLKNHCGAVISQDLPWSGKIFFIFFWSFVTFPGIEADWKKNKKDRGKVGLDVRLY